MEKLGLAMQDLEVDATASRAELAGAQVISALRSLSWKIGGEHLLYENLKDEATGLVSEAKLRFPMQQAHGITSADALEWLDANGDGKVCAEDLNTKVVRTLFEEQFVAVTAVCAKAALTSMAQTIPANKREKPAVQCLAGLSDEDLEECARSSMAALLASLKELRDEIKSPGKEKNKTDEAACKFEFQPEQSFLCRTLDMFKHSLETFIGTPSFSIREGMQREHYSTERFTTESFGGVSTFDRQEFDLIDKQVDVDYEFTGAREKRDVDAMLSSWNIREDGVWKRLTREEVIALVLFTGPMGEKYNQVLSQVLLPIAERMQAGEEIEMDFAPVSYATTIHMIVSGISKLSEAPSPTGSHKVYCGLRGNELLDPFTKGIKRGTPTRASFMSTTRDIAVAKESTHRHAAQAQAQAQHTSPTSAQWPTILEIETEGQVGRGACVAMLSQFPREQEELFPPLCSVYVVGDARLVWERESGSACWVVPARLEAGVRSSTREEQEESWKSQVLGTARTLLLDTKTALLEQLNSARKSNPEDGSELYASLLEEGRMLQRRMRGVPAAWFNDDRNLEMTLIDLVTLRARAVEAMESFCVDALQRPAPHFTAHSMMTWHRLKLGDLRDAYGDASARGEAEAYGAAWKVAVMEGLLQAGDAYRWGGLDGETSVMRAAVQGNAAHITLLADAKCDLNAVSARHCTALFAAVAVGHAHAVQRLLELRADPNMGRVDTGETPALLAAEHGRSACLKLLVAGGADVRRQSGVSGATPLHEAAIKGFVEMMPCLAEAGADIHAEDNDGDQPIHVAAMYGQAGCAKWLKEAGADIRAPRSSDGNQPIHLAAANGHTMCGKWLTEAGANVHARNAAGNQAIHLGHVACGRWLLAAGADVHAENKKGSRALHLAVMNGQQERVKWLVAAGADVRAANHNGSQALHLAAIFGHEECARLLQEAGADLQAANTFGDQPLHLAAMHGQLPCGMWLVEAGADPTAPNTKGHQPIHVAAGRGHVGWVAWLVEERGVDVSSKSYNADQPIHLAAWNGHLECVSWLLAAGADKHAPNADGRQPVHMAAAANQVACLAELRAAGADVAAADAAGNTALHLAAAAGHLACLAWLRVGQARTARDADAPAEAEAEAEGEAEAEAEGEAGCLSTLARVNADGKRAVDLAEANGHVQCAQLLNAAAGISTSASASASASSSTPGLPVAGPTAAVTVAAPVFEC